jgi:glycosyltransferase involved in cell wall biosynthesis/predicted O-methyltransferase YrrM
LFSDMTLAPPLAVDRDYVSPGLKVVRPDAAFPRMRPGERAGHPWPYLRREIPHLWYVDERYPDMGFLNRDEASILHNIALQFRGRRALEIGSWLGWSTCHLGLAGVELDVIDPAHADPQVRASVDHALRHCGIADRVHLRPDRSPDAVHTLAAMHGRKWSLFFIDGDHEGLAPVLDTLACRPYAEPDCAFVFHDLAAPAVAAALRLLRDDGFQVRIYQTAQIMAMAWRGNVEPVAHVADPDVKWELPEHLAGWQMADGGWQKKKPQVIARTFPPPSAIRHPPLTIRHPPSALNHPPSTCIVTNEVLGIFRNGGIGTSMTGLAETLAEAGMKVTVLYTGHVGSAATGLEVWREHYRAKGIELVTLTIEDARYLDGPLRHCAFVSPWLIYTYLVEHRFDVVHFNDCRGEGSLALAAKRLNLAFHDTLLVLALHSPSQWVLELNQTSPASSTLAAFSYGEHLSVKCADVVWAPSRYMLGWVRDHDFALPERTYVQPYAIPAPPGARDVAYGAAPRPGEIVFFGRLEERKGLRLFCNALDALHGDLVARGITVTFLGKPNRCGGMESGDYIAHRAAQWQFPTKVLTDFGQAEALAYLGEGNRLAVMASPVDNSPCTVYEALACGFPFLASRTGGIPELIHDEDRDRVLFEHSTEGLTARLADVLERGGWIARPAMTQDETRATWVSMHEHWRDYLPGPARMGHIAPSRIVAIVDPAGKASSVERTVASLKDCPGVRRVVVLDRNDASAFREVLASLADDAVLLVHAGAAVQPEPLARMLMVLRAEGVEGFLPAAEVRIGDVYKILPHLGGSAPFALFEGATFTGGLLVRADVLLRAMRGRELALESPFFGLADFCLVRGELWPFPEPVFSFEDDWRIRFHDDHPARVAAYAECAERDRVYIMAAGYRASKIHPEPFGRHKFAMMLVDAGFGPVMRVGLWGLRLARRVRHRVKKMLR